MVKEIKMQINSHYLVNKKKTFIYKCHSEVAIVKNLRRSFIKGKYNKCVLQKKQAKKKCHEKERAVMRKES